MTRPGRCPRRRPILPQLLRQPPASNHLRPVMVGRIIRGHPQPIPAGDTATSRRNYETPEALRARKPTIPFLEPT